MFVTFAFVSKFLPVLMTPIAQTSHLPPLTHTLLIATQRYVHGCVAYDKNSMLVMAFDIRMILVNPRPRRGQRIIVVRLSVC